MRQVEFTSRKYFVDLIGFGNWAPPWPNVRFFEIRPLKASSIRRLRRAAYLLGGRVWPSLWDRAYWDINYRREALNKVLQDQYSIILANDLETLPIAVKAARQTRAKVFFDAHEYSPDQVKGNEFVRSIRIWSINDSLQRLLPCIDAFTTVSPGVAELYSAKFGITPEIILNAPKKEEITHKEAKKTNIRIVHHGNADRRRKLESLIELVEYLDKRYTLSLYLIGNQDDYIEQLKDLARTLAGDRVFFYQPVLSDEVVATLSNFDIGVHILPPTAQNFLYALPNKLFEFICAGLAVVVSPSPDMARIVKEYEIGVVAKSFNPKDLAVALNSLSVHEINLMKRNALFASQDLNADVEMPKLLRIYQDLLN